jgi:hypothetical protein
LENDKVSTDQQKSATINTTNTLVPERTPLIPIDTTDSTKFKDTPETECIHETHINELSQEEAEYISNEIAKYEQQNTWIPVVSKKSISKTTRLVDSLTPPNTNPYMLEIVPHVPIASLRRYGNFVFV